MSILNLVVKIQRTFFEFEFANWFQQERATLVFLPLILDDVSHTEFKFRSCLTHGKFGNPCANEVSSKAQEPFTPSRGSVRVPE